MTRLIVASANLNVKNDRAAQGVRNLQRVVFRRFSNRIDVAGLQEARLLDAGGVGFLMVRRAIGAGQPLRWSGLNPQAVKPWFKVFGLDWHFGAQGDLGEYGMSPRNFTVLRYRKWGKKFANVNSHFHVLGDPVATRSEKARQYIEHGDLLLAEVEELRSQGYRVTVTMDHNCPDRDWRYSMVRRLRASGFTVITTNRDLVACDSARFKVVHSMIVPAETLQGDHDAIVVKAKTRRK